VTGRDAVLADGEEEGVLVGGAVVHCPGAIWARSRTAVAVKTS
jgi:hypothetical protein